MSKRELLLKKIKENNGIITTREALNLGIHKDILKELTIKISIPRASRGTNSNESVLHLNSVI